MAPRNFSEDGAVGAHAGGDTAIPNNGSSQTNFGGVSMLGNPGGDASGGFTSPMGTKADEGPGFSPMGGYGNSDSGINVSNDTTGFSSERGYGGAFSFSAGGAIDEETGEAGGDNGLQGSITKALGVVGAALSYGRKLHGIGGGQDEGDGEAIQTADRMPSVPGNPYGQQREQPMPGPLPPTKTPFGKRADAGEEAVPTDDEEAA